MGHRGALLDEQAFDLMKHRVVRGVGSIGPVDTAERHDPQGRLAGFHDTDLHGARLRPQEQRVAALGDVEIEVVERIPGRMLRWNRQGFEVVPLVFDLRAVDAFEAQAGHDALHLADGAGDRMQPAKPHRTAGQRDINRSGLGRCGCRCEPILSLFEQRGNGLLELVEGSPRLRPIRGTDATEQLLNRLELAALGPDERDPRLFERGGAANLTERRFSFIAKPAHLEDKRFKIHALAKPARHTTRETTSGRGCDSFST